MELAEVCEGYWYHYRRLHEGLEEAVWAWEFVDAIAMGRSADPEVDALALFAQLAISAPDEHALAYLGAGPLEDYLSSDLLNIDALADALQANEKLRHAFVGYARSPEDLSVDQQARLRTLFGGRPW